MALALGPFALAFWFSFGLGEVQFIIRLVVVRVPNVLGLLVWLFFARNEVCGGQPERRRKRAQFGRKLCSPASTSCTIMQLIHLQLYKVLN